MNVGCLCRATLVYAFPSANGVHLPLLLASCLNPSSLCPARLPGMIPHVALALLLLHLAART